MSDSISAAFTDAKAKTAPKPIEADVNGLVYFGHSRMYSYHHHKHTLADVLTDGYFDNVTAKNPIYFGAQLFYSIGNGKNDPDEWSSGILRIVRVRGCYGADATEATRVRIVARFQDGPPVESEQPKKRIA